MSDSSDNASLKEPISQMRESGYCVVESVFSYEFVDELSARLDHVADIEKRNGDAWFSHSNQRVFMLLNKSSTFLGLISHPSVLGLATACLGEHRLLSSITANIAMPGNQAQPLHADQGYVAEPWRHSEVMNVAILLDHFSEENGATAVVPGSHLIGTNPPPLTLPSIPIVAPRGSLVGLDGRVWHGTGENRTARTRRRAIFCYYCKPYLRQQENFSRSLAPEVRERLTAVDRQLLGFDIWLGLGAVNGLPPEWMDGRERIGPSLDEHQLRHGRGAQ